MSSRMTLVFERQGPRAWTMHTPWCDVPEIGEREGPAAMRFMCEEICGHQELFGFRHGAARWFEKIRIDPETLSPRASLDEPHCRGRTQRTDARGDDAAQPGDYVREHGVERERDAEIVNREAGKYCRRPR
jgi:hypothetical protein